MEAHYWKLRIYIIELRRPEWNIEFDMPSKQNGEWKGPFRKRLATQEPIPGAD